MGPLPLGLGAEGREPFRVEPAGIGQVTREKRRMSTSVQTIGSVGGTDPLGPSEARSDLDLSTQLASRARNENFPVALRVLPRHLRNDLMALYGFARFVDQIGDEWGGDRLELLDHLEAEITLAEKGSSAHPAVVPVQPLLRRPGFDPALLRKLVQANRQDQTVHRYRTFAELLGYCDLSANPLGRLVLALFGAFPPARVADASTRAQRGRGFPDAEPTGAGEPTGGTEVTGAGEPTPTVGPAAERGGCGDTTDGHPVGEDSAAMLRASDSICSALQVIEHLQDVGEDFRDGRVYLPEEDMDRVGCAEADLASDRAGLALRAVVCIEARRARCMLGEGLPLLRMLSGWGRLAVAGFVAGGEAALDSVEAAGHDVLGRDCRPRRGRVAWHMGRLLVASAPSPMLRSPTAE